MSGGMDMGRFHSTHDRVVANSGAEFADIPKLVVANGQLVRLVGNFASNWEHFPTLPSGPRPYYCEGPESDCPLCQATAQLVMSGEEEKQKLGDNIKAKEKFYFNCLDRSPTGRQWHTTNKKPYVLAQNPKGFNIGSQLFQAIGAVVKMRQQQGQPDDPNGYDIMLQKTGSGMQTKYGAQFSGDLTPLTEEELAYPLWPLDQISRITPLHERQAVADYILGKGPLPTNVGDATFDPAKLSAEGPASQQPQQPSLVVQGAPAGATVVGQSVGTGQPQQPQQPSTVAPVTAPTTPAPAAVTQPQKTGVVQIGASSPATPVASTQQATPAQPAQPVLTPQQQYQDTTPGRQVDMSTHMEVPCSTCQAQMLFSMEDVRDLKCYNCGQIYTHPTKS